MNIKTCRDLVKGDAPEKMLGLGAVGVLLFLASMAFLTFPTVDDVWFGALARSRGVWDGMLWFYTHWSGRWASTLLMGATAALPGYVWLYGLLMVANMGLFLAAHKLLWDALWPKMGWVPWLMLSAVFLASLDVSEVLAWQAGGFTYVTALTLTCLMGVALVKATPAWVAAGVVMGFLLGGMNETQTVTTGALLLGVLALQMGWPLRLTPAAKRILPAVLLMGCAMAVGLLTTALAPGNGVRAAAIDARWGVQNPFWNLRLMAWLPFIHVESVASFGALFGCLWLALGTPPALPAWLKKMDWKVLVGGMFILTFLSMVPRAAMLAGPGPHRAYTSELAVLAAGMFLLTAKLFVPMARPFALRWLAVAVSVPLLLGLRGADWLTLRDQMIAGVVDGVPAYRTLWARNVYLTQGGLRGVVEVPAVHWRFAKPPNLYMDVPAEDGELNRQFGAFYGVESVVGTD